MNCTKTRVDDRSRLDLFFVLALPKNLEGAVLWVAGSVAIRGKTRIPSKNRKIPEMTVPMNKDFLLPLLNIFYERSYELDLHGFCD